ncbi:MAG: hypothetical protein HRT58_14580 [Crocinitomicaceae bacterium]|nr:hypothetical protein [Flavobacteriales bacterium]NQZ36893.1 hypothetical protein [Crocinitomicaceae bacterium]
MRHLITLIVLATCVQLSFAVTQVKSYYFKKNSVELTADFMIETNGQPNLSDGHFPSIKSLDYGHGIETLKSAIQYLENLIKME